MADDSWKRPPGGFRYRYNSPAGQVERLVAALRHQGRQPVLLGIAIFTALVWVTFR